MAGVRRKSRGVLPVIAVLLVTSAAVRIVGGAGPVLAEELAAPAPAPSPEATPVMATETSMLPDELIAALQAREARVADREARLADRLQALRVAEMEIEEKLVALEEAEESLAALLALASSAAENDIARLTQVYENMKPQDSAALFQTMEPAFSAGFIGRMQPEAAAAIMSNIEPETAYLISVILAGRNANAPTE